MTENAIEIVGELRRKTNGRLLGRFQPVHFPAAQWKAHRMVVAPDRQSRAHRIGWLRQSRRTVKPRCGSIFINILVSHVRTILVDEEAC